MPISCNSWPKIGFCGVYMIILFPRQIISLVLTALAVVVALSGRLFAAVTAAPPRGPVAGSSFNLTTRDASSALIPDTSGFPATITRHFPSRFSAGQGSA